MQGPETTALQEQLAITMMRISRAWRTRMDGRLAGLGLTQGKWNTLYHLSMSEGPVMQRDLATIVGVEGPTMVRLLDGLERQGLIERIPAAHDRRGKMIRLTAASEPVVSEMCRISRQLKAEIFADIPDSELEHCHQVLLKVQQKLEG